MRSAEVVIVGAGIIGAAAAFALAQRGVTDVAILEQEDMPNRHSSGRNASYYLPMYDTPCFSALAQASMPFFLSPPDGFTEAPMFEPRGAVIAEIAGVQLAAEIDEARSLGIAVESLTPDEAGKLIPILKTDWFASAAYYPGAGPLDVHALSMGYLKAARRAGVRVEAHQRVLGICAEHGRVLGVETASGFLACRTVVNAAGAWAGHIGRLAGARPITLVPHRRHIVSLPLGLDLAGQTWPFFRCPSLPVYMKPEGTQLLASRMDATADEPGDCIGDDLEIAAVADAVATHTTLPVRRVTRAWAGHRTFASDDAPVIGPDPLVDGFIWAAGLGGAGVMASPVVGQLVADAITGIACNRELAAVSPSRTGL
jgi:D-arginine dehydrogenase